MVMKIVLITGAGSNLGFGLAKRFLAEDSLVILVDANKQFLLEASEKLERIDPKRVFSFVCDIADERAVGRLFTRLKKRFDPIDVLVNNAAMQGVGFSFTQTPLKTLDSVIQVNIRGTFLVGQRAALSMLKVKRGVIINIGSNTAKRALRNRSAYIMSKGAIDALTLAMALDLAPHIRVNAVVPGYIWTPRWNAIGLAKQKTRRSSIPLHEPASFDDIADMVLFLASDKAKNITGARFVIDGGCSSQLLPESVDV
jgi:NAD(P)-dependent dehydrogenase (short-subunit alcohol dehydrogenase family)